MKFSENWLRTWVNPPIDRLELIQQFTLAGLEVDDFAPVAAQLQQVLVAEIVSLTAHPQAENLHICSVNTGNNLFTVVCGADNVQPGIKVALAVPGAKLGAKQIITTDIRGISSQGMLCAAHELGLTDNISTGILHLPADAPLGQNINDYLQLDDYSIEIDITPNRGDCLSLIGLAREVAAFNALPFDNPEIPNIPPQIDHIIPIEIRNTAANPRYVGRVIRQVNPNASTPIWMLERLRRSGVRGINAIVDVTNYVMLELGQPMHAFDLNKLNGGIIVRSAQENENLTLLDGREIQLQSSSLVIADHNQAQALAGIMGGLATAVDANTVDILLESAFFAPKPLAGQARKYGLHTDSSFRFERGVDFQLQRQAIERATALILDIAAGQPGPVMEVVDGSQLPATPSITLRHNRIKRILGYDLAFEQINAILPRLGMQITANTEYWLVQPPSFRFDIRLEVDLIEELARIYGYDKIPELPPQAGLNFNPPSALSITQLQAVLVQRGYQEAITYSFVDPQWQREFDPDNPALAVANPISQDLSVMRTQLWSGLLAAVQYNSKRQISRIRLFETGLRFVLENGNIAQQNCIAGVIAGSIAAEQWAQTQREADFYDLKADVEALLQLGGFEYKFISYTHPALQPGQTAAIELHGEIIGLLGAVHPRLVRHFALPSNSLIFELQLPPLLNKSRILFKPISKYPSIRRDLALVLDQAVSWQSVLACIQEQQIANLTEILLFDVYTGQNIGVGKKSLAIGLIFQAVSRNLTESEVDELLRQLLATLASRLNAELRK
jgi:phenylalanyl-tRNA synthetase beta chain